MADTRFTMLGMSGSGKTCFITGMWAQMSSGIDGFTFVTNDDTRIRLQRDIQTLRHQKGEGRFPQATANSKEAIRHYEFEMNKDREKIISFEMIDYAGGSLDGGGSVLIEVEQSIAESTALFIFIDGLLFCTEDKEDRADNVKYDCAMTITPIFDQFAKSHPDQPLPPVVFVVTKSDLCKQFVKQEEIVRLIKSNFSPAFGNNDTNSYICAISLGNEISDNNYSGRFRPINTYLPFFIGAYHEFYNLCSVYNSQANESNIKLDEERYHLSRELDAERNRWLFKRKDYIKKLERDIINNNDARINNNKILDKYKNLLFLFGSHLEAESNNFKWFVNGVEQSNFVSLRL